MCEGHEVEIASNTDVMFLGEGSGLGYGVRLRRQAGAQAHANRERRLSPRSPPRTRPASRGRRERSSHQGLQKRTAAHARRRLERKNGGFWRSQFCTEVARSEGFEPPTPRFEV